MGVPVALSGAFATILAIRYLERRQQMYAESWPMVTATIETGMETDWLPYYRWYDPRFLCLFPYSYCVTGCCYAGKLALRAENDADGQELQSRLVGRKIAVRYDPAHPEVSIPSESNIDGHPVLVSSALTKWCEKSDLLDRRYL